MTTKLEMLEKEYDNAEVAAAEAAATWHATAWDATWFNVEDAGWTVYEDAFVAADVAYDKWQAELKKVK